MSIDKSLRRKNSLERTRSVLTRDERIKVMMENERWPDGRSPYGLPKVRVIKILKKGPKKEKVEGEAVAAPVDAKGAKGGKAAAPAAKAAAPAAKAAAKPAAKPAAKKK